MNTPTGLSAHEAALRLQQDGPNELPQSGPRHLAIIVRDVLAEPMFLLLLAAAGIYIVLGDVREAAVLAASMLIVVAITVMQERRSEHALARLRDLSSPRALVIRDGKEQRIAGREVVVGDVLLLREGDRIPADGLLLHANALSVDESILTGESLPVDKSANESAERAVREVFSGTLVVHGYGAAQVIATGVRTQIGGIGRSLGELRSETTPLFREVRSIVRWVAAAALLLCAVIAVIYGYSRNDVLGGVLAGITVAMGVLPEEFPVVLTIFLAMGAWRISRHGVLTRRMPAVESMGSVSVLAVDKTGTLTENRMRVAVVAGLEQEFDLRRADTALDRHAREILFTALAASEIDAFDPMEQAIAEAAARAAADRASELRQAVLTREYELTPQLLAVTHVWRLKDSDTLQVMMKGAPETILDLCRIDAPRRAMLMERVNRYARDGLRVLGVAAGSHVSEPLPESPYAFDVQLLGFVCLADPLRADVAGALRECTLAGIRVVMITGDHPGTALAIAGQAGFDVTAGALTGAELAAMSDEQVRERARTVNVYARTRPEQKLRLVEALKRDGAVVAMTGDGVNDAPALKAAHVGVAMGRRGTDVAREAASLVLVNDDFGSLVGAVRLGRRVYRNIQHAMSYIVAVHIPVAGMGLLPVLFGWPLLLFPLHVLFLEFVIDPACSFVFEADETSGEVMREPPRQRGARLFSRRMLMRNLTFGAIVLLFVASIYATALHYTTEEAARGAAFVTMVLSNLGLILASRAGGESLRTVATRNNPVFWWISAAAIGTLAVTLFVPPVAALFRFAAPSPALLAMATALAAGLTVLLALLQRLWHQPRRRSFD